MMYTGILIILIVLGASMGDKIEPSKNKNFNDEYDYLFIKYGNSYGIDPLFLKAIAANESSVGKAVSVAYGIKHPTEIYTSASSDKKSWGLMQLTKATANQFEPGTTEADLNDPEKSVRLAAKYISWVMKNYSRDIEFLARAYNGGPGWKKTVMGPSATAIYWSRFQKNYLLAKEDGI